MMIAKYLLAVASVIKSLNWPEFEQNFSWVFQIHKMEINLLITNNNKLERDGDHKLCKLWICLSD